MALYTGVGSTAKKVSKLYVGVGGTAHRVKKVYVGVGGTARLVYTYGSPLSTKAVGSTVKIKINGSYWEFIIVHRGNPNTSLYDSSCNGTWLLLKSLYTNMKWAYSDSGVWYNNSAIHSYINSTFYNAIESGVRGLIKQVKVPYYTNVNDRAILSSGLSTKVFLLCAQEVGIDDDADGSVLSYFNGASNSKRASSNDWWLRSRNYWGNAPYITSAGALSSGHPSSYNLGVRPAFILPDTCLVADDGSITT